ncbi:N-acetylmuramoyl-L-alanine amidase [Romboutsia sp. 1001216sp1]|uniref:N-acetylmuramoyl-L-alanine amidase n=1 Tax=Romboutsia sp. 1001216sp1 TaxID=2986997 RepID=UPI00232E3A6C|nr:N-acetylmuramoyl-L-alanine amidase [Romboutsia sp. 1001216sp1]MDB8805001.1 N-acetylmuramoyl-L-alanine amidase [Romboutsia sp. 1001216sp1]MDB8807991.1 N-acetylmuramoyl-L-alanine amidase [Romboutsia sp. 1001216sp1]MDB8810646.1 N-acetylmuramoyl-L-alanine amidase [Romboutsia sp. 1001216sp1]MDB8816366.1 N-acetylmuramoyl-L-alanine amidase [Romboutsia sp. 1001216sp1]MDB8818681.1 N-acetylmuramoyl-L-alanine amidase [Romboutsia sp. 1001216sp1]
MKICITVGHSILKNGNCTSAGGYVQEYKYCKELAPLIANYLKQEKHTVDVIVCPERQFSKAYEEKTYKLSKVNKKGYDLLVELHLNAFNGSAKGTEVLYYSDRGKTYAQRVNDKLDDIFTDRGIKKRTDLYILRDTDCPAILVEAFFCDNKEDYQKADEVHEKDLIAKKIAEGILNRSLTSTTQPQQHIFNNGSYKGRRARVTANVLKVRWDRGTNHKVIGKLNKGYIVKLNYCLNSWMSIDGFKGNKGLGYVSTDYIELIQ